MTPMTDLDDRIEHARKVYLALANELLTATSTISQLRRDLADCRRRTIEECAMVAGSRDASAATAIRAMVGPKGRFSAPLSDQLDQTYNTADEIGAAPRGRAAPRPGRAEDSPSSRPGLTEGCGND